MKIETFKQLIWDYYHKHKRDFAWRNTHNPYHIVVSEIMLQQTQTHRVAQKYPEFLNCFSSFTTLAHAQLREVLATWQGLGYNRRGIYLHKIAQKVVNEYNGKLPDDPNILVTFPGIGKNTAGSICAFAFNKPIVFIETNIRSVFIHFFFPDKAEIHDEELLPLIEQTIDYHNPREWYYALMDYGVKLKKERANPSRQSKHHHQQSKFQGSHRQIRGMILRALILQPTLHFTQLCEIIPREEQRIEKALKQLYKEGFIKKKEEFFSIV